MAILRLKGYMREIYEKYLLLEEEPTEDKERTETAKRIRANYQVVVQTVLFFNQSEEEKSIEEWSKEVDISYQIEMDNFISLTEDSTKWAISAINNEWKEPEALTKRIIFDINNYKIKEITKEEDVITRQYIRLCSLIHGTIEDNLRKRRCLIRLIWSYLSAKELTEMGRNLSGYNRLEYLRKLTKY